MNDRRNLIREFRAWRKAEGLDFNPSFVPRRFADIKDLEDGYWHNEQAAKREEVQHRRQAPPAPPRSDYVSRKHFDKMLEVIGRWVGQKIAEALRASVEPMRQRLAELEAMPRFEFRGVWREGMTGKPYESVMRGGSLWIATRETDKVPGEPDSGWRLAVKKGRDARERKDTSK
jgi:hypothetical protein